MPKVIPAAYAKSAIRLLKRPGAELAALLREVGLPETLLEQDAAGEALSAEQFGRLFIGIVRLSQQDLHERSGTTGDILSLSTYRLMFSYMLQAPTLAEAIERAALFFLRFNDARQSFSLLAGDPAELRFNLAENEDEGVRIEHFCMGKLNWLPGLPGRISALYMWHRLCSWMTGSFIDLAAVNVDLPLRGDVASVVGAFRAPVYFRQPHCSLLFHRRYLDFPVIRTESDLNRMLETFPAELMRADEMADSVSARVRALIGQDFGRDLPSLEEVARRLHMATATLHRRLQGEGTSFQRIKDACRRDSAIRLLRSSSMSGQDIAARLGFSDSSAFLRAFKKWTGCTPMEFRQAGH
jgi:AraC-like DNA-binding protein